jgi:hypothetical protein
VVLSSTESARCSMPCAKSSAVCSSELEKMATELRQKCWIHRASSGGTRCRTSTRNRPLARPRRSVQAAYLRRDRLTIYDRLQRSADQTDPSPPEPHRRPSQSLGATDRASGTTAARIMQFIVLEQGFQGARLNTGTMRDLQILAATLLTNFATVRITRCESLCISSSIGTGCCHAYARRRSAYCTASGRERAVLGMP